MTAILHLNSKIILGLSIVLIAFILVLELIRLLNWLPPKNFNFNTKVMDCPFISVHLAIHEEHPEMVIATIKSIMAQQYENFELLVIDNNTSSASTWQPVKLFCEDYDNIRFFHLKNWPHYKAGALNFGRRVTHATAQYIFIVDADYKLFPDALLRASKSMNNETLALVQFPQSYRLEKAGHAPILADFNHFFEHYCHKANRCLGALATGTLSLIRVNALDRIGGWPTNSITEDAELGVRMQSRGYNIMFVPEIIGTGLAPIHQSDFLKQRRRWVFGNAQTLFNYPINPFKNFKKYIIGITQLTAWSNLLGLPIIIILASIFSIFLGKNFDVELILTINICSIWLVFFGKLLQLIEINGYKAKEIFGSFLIFITSLHIGAFYWWPALIGKEKPFVKTDKRDKPNRYNFNLGFVFLFAGLSIVAIATANHFVIGSAISFAILFLISGLFDCYCRTGSIKNFNVNLIL